MKLQYPPALAISGEMRSGTKSDLVKCILPDPVTSTIDAQPKTTGSVLEGSVLVNLVKPKKNQSFKDYSSEVFYPQFHKQQDLHVADILNVVFDTYKEESLKTTTRVKRGKRCSQESVMEFSGANELERFPSFRSEQNRIILLLT